MRPATLAAPPPAPGAAAPRSDWAPLKSLLPYVWQWRWRVRVALSFLVGAKLANIGVPLVLKQLVDAPRYRPGAALTRLARVRCDARRDLQRLDAVQRPLRVEHAGLHAV